MSSSDSVTDRGTELSHDTELLLPPKPTKSFITRARTSLSWTAMKSQFPSYETVRGSISEVLQTLGRVLTNSREALTRGNKVANFDCVPAGTLLLEGEPFAFVLDEYFRVTHCGYCFAYRTESEAFGRCGKCFHIRYCDRICLGLDWKEGHKYECRGLKQWRQEQVQGQLDKEQDALDAARLIIRVLSKLENGQTLHHDRINSKMSRTFTDLATHYEDIRNEDLLEIVRVQDIVIKLLQGRTDIRFPVGEDFIELFGRIHTNTFAIHDSDFVKMGTGLYLGASYFNHSCNPTAVVTFESTKISIRTLTDLPFDFPLERVTICYIDPIQPTARRIEELKSRYYFECNCERCQHRLDDADMISIGCQFCKFPLNLTVDTECRNCQGIPTMRFVRKTKKLHDKAKRLIHMGALAHVKQGFEIQDLIRLMQRLGYSPTHWLLVQLCVMAVDIGIEEEKPHVAYEYMKLALPGLRRYLHPNHALLGVHLMKAGKLAWYMQHDSVAKSYFKDAVQAILVSFGKDSTFYKNFVENFAQHIVDNKRIPEVNASSSIVDETDSLNSESSGDAEDNENADDEASSIPDDEGADENEEVHTEISKVESEESASEKEGKRVYNIKSADQLEVISSDHDRESESDGNEQSRRIVGTKPTKDGYDGNDDTGSDAQDEENANTTDRYVRGEQQKREWKDRVRLHKKHENDTSWVTDATKKQFQIPKGPFGIKPPTLDSSEDSSSDSDQ